jgi:hypothetical protein
MYEIAKGWHWHPRDLFELTIPQLLALLHEGSPPEAGARSFRSSAEADAYSKSQQ